MRRVRFVSVALMATLGLAGCSFFNRASESSRGNVEAKAEPTLDESKQSIEDPATFNIGASQRGQPALFFAPGDEAARLDSLTITAQNLRLNDSRCSVPNAEQAYTVQCVFGVDVPAGRRFVLEMSGRNVEAVAYYSRVRGDDRQSFAKRLVPGRVALPPANR